MRNDGNSFELSATDLASYLNCDHLSTLERAVAEGNLKKPHLRDPLLKVLWERGSIHEQNFVDHLTTAGLEVIRIDGFDVSPEAVDLRQVRGPSTIATVKLLLAVACLMSFGGFIYILVRWVIE